MRTLGWNLAEPFYILLKIKNKAEILFPKMKNNLRQTPIFSPRTIRIFQEPLFSHRTDINFPEASIFLSNRYSLISRKDISLIGLGGCFRDGIKIILL